MMIKSFSLTCLFLLGSGFAQAQPEPRIVEAQPDPEQFKANEILLDAMRRKRPFEIRRALELAKPQGFEAPVKQVVDVGDVVVNVVIAKVLTEGTEPKLIVAKFGGKESSANRPATTTSFRDEKRTLKVMVGDEQIEQIFTVNIPVTTVVNQKQNFTPTEQNRSLPVSYVQAFDLKGNPVEASQWTKRLETPQHVLLLSSPIAETNKLNSFYASILREDMLMLFLGQQKVGQQKAGIELIEESLSTVVYRVNGLPVWSVDGNAADPNDFIQLVQTQVTPNAWQGEAKIVPFQANQSLLVTANAKTHEGIQAFLFELRKELARLGK